MNGFIVILFITDEANPMRALEMLFFALFGLTRPEDLQMTKKVDSWVESWVKLIMATYLLLTGIVLINLLIAMMSDTYQRISVMKRLQIKAYGLIIIIYSLLYHTKTTYQVLIYSKNQMSNGRRAVQH